MKVDELIYHIKEVLSWEKKKAVLPVLMCIILVSAIFGLYHLRGSNYDKQGIEDPVTVMTASMKYFILDSHYNQSINSTVFRGELKELRQDVREESPLKKKDFLASAAPLFAVYRTPFFILEPSDSVVAGDGSASVFRPVNGYYLSEEEPEAVVELQFIQLKSQKIEEEIVEHNMTVFKAMGRFEAIKRQSLQQKASYVLENRERESNISSNGLMTANIDGGNELTTEEIYVQVAEDSVKEIQWYHFLPAFAATFMLYYVVNAFLLAGIRRIRS